MTNFGAIYARGQAASLENENAKLRRKLETLAVAAANVKDAAQDVLKGITGYRLGRLDATVDALGVVLDMLEDNE